MAEYDAAEGPVHPVVRLIPETGRRVRRVMHRILLAGAKPIPAA